jgi:uncharacterized membrane protein YiaA
MSLKRGTLFGILIAIGLVLVALFNLSLATWLAVIYLVAYTLYNFLGRKRKRRQET